MEPPTQDVLEAIRAGRPSDGGPGVGLVDILERVDARQRWLLSHWELDGALQRLSERGSIHEIGPRRYVADPAAAVGPYLPLTIDEYRAAAKQYRDEFADDVAKVVPLLKGLGPPTFDADDVAIAFVLERVVRRFHGTLGESVGRGPLSYPLSLPADADITAFTQAARSALAERLLGAGDTWLLLANGDRIQVGGT